MIQIAGVTDLEEALMLAETGIDYLGFPLRLKDGREDISEEYAKQIISKISMKTTAVLITYLDNSKDIVDLSNYLDVKVVQLHGRIELPEVIRIKNLLQHISIIKSLVVRGDNLDELLSEIDIYSKHIDYFITDTFDPETGRSGATGLTHNWEISGKLAELSSRPLILAGGLNPDNVFEAIMRVKPAGVDSHTCVENTSGRKDPELVKKFISEARRGFNYLSNESKN